VSCSAAPLQRHIILGANVHLFSFNNPYGACPVCEGYGIIGIDAELVIPNTTLSLRMQYFHGVEKV
jgi:excinuclease UvrABC ATPase subunit